MIAPENSSTTGITEDGQYPASAEGAVQRRERGEPTRLTKLGFLITDRRKELESPISGRKPMTQRDLADALGIKSSEHIHYIEKGRRSLEVGKLAKLAKALQMPALEVLKAWIWDNAPEVAVALLEGNDPKALKELADGSNIVEVKVTPPVHQHLLKLANLTPNSRRQVLLMTDTLFETEQRANRHL
jgi:transcriptional regulator with XRE-family HTH domain